MIDLYRVALTFLMAGAVFLIFEFRKYYLNTVKKIKGSKFVFKSVFVQAAIVFLSILNIFLNKNAIISNIYSFLSFFYIFRALMSLKAIIMIKKCEDNFTCCIELKEKLTKEEIFDFLKIQNSKKYENYRKSSSLILPILFVINGSAFIFVTYYICSYMDNWLKNTLLDLIKPKTATPETLAKAKNEWVKNTDTKN